MAGEPHEYCGGDAEGDRKALGTRSRRASYGEELPSHSSSSSTLSNAEARRLSLPTALPAPTHFLAASVPECNPRTLDAVRPCRMLTPQFQPCYRACPHRTHTNDGGPPCYLCSVLDVPPKYRRREARGWQRLREKLAQLSRGSPGATEGGPRLEHSPPATVFTISECQPSDPPGPVRPEEVSASLSTAPSHVRSQERDNPAFDSQDSGEGGGVREAHSGAPPQLPPASAAITTEGVSYVPLPPPLPPSTLPQVAPPPYSTLVTNPFRQPYLPARESESSPTSRCNRRLMCQLLYSLLLATASSTLIVNYQQPIIVITSVIVFMAMFVFLPIIAVIECLFRCKMEQDFRQYLQNIMSTSAPSVSTMMI